MRAKNPLPQSQKRQIRQVARAAWIESDCDFDLSAILCEQRVPRVVGGAWAMDAVDQSKQLLVYWDQNKIDEPAAVAVAGEPGTDFFESDEE